MLASLSRWVREGPAAALVPTRFRTPIERLTVSRAYPAVPGPLCWSLAPEREAAVLFGGDLALHRWDPGLEAAGPLAGLGALSTAADALILNLETQFTAIEAPIGTIGSSLRARPGAAGVLQALGIKAVCCANNHCLDFGAEALSESVARIESAGIVTSGVLAHDRDGAGALEVRGVRIGLLAYTDDWRVGEASSEAVRPAPHDPAAVRADIQRLRSGVQVLVVQLHWGYEWSMYPMRSQRDLARSYIDAGADLVVCHHAHVPMGIERWGRGAIAHGLGNLYFGRTRSTHHPFVHASFLLRVGMSARGITDLEVIPVGTGSTGLAGPLPADAAAHMASAVAYLSGRLADDAYLSAVESALWLRHGCEVVVDLDRRVASGDWGGIRERIRFLTPPRQRQMTAWLVARGGEPAFIGALLEQLRDGIRDLQRPADLADLRAARRIAVRLLERNPQRGRIP
jgi:poly-gamma-glutamate synthesis protein (capsule biosynthesis protein)